MKHKIVLSVFMTLAASLFASGLLAESQDWPDVTEDGLVRVDDTKMAVVYADPDASLAGYTRVMLAEPEVAFKKNWERDFRSQSAVKLSTSSRVDTNKIKQQLAEEFMTVFTDKLTAAGYEIVDEPGEDVLLVAPSIINLAVNAPETTAPGRTNQYVKSAGEMTLYVELYDSMTGDLIAKAIDRQIDRENNRMYTWANSTSNKAAADRILNGWADILVEALDEAKTVTIVVEEDVVEEN